MNFTRVFMMCFKRALLYVFLLGILLISFGCDSGEGAIVSATQTPIPKYTLPPVIKDTVPAPGGEITFAIPNKEGTSYNPLKVKNVELFNYFSLIYEKPIRIGADGKFLPELVETWTHDETGTVWTFTLRKGVKWQRDNGELTSADLLYTIGLIRTYSQADSSYAAYNSIIADCTALDPYTVSITLTEPGNAALYFMTFPVLCQKYLNSNNIDSSAPVGTGPYIVSDYNLPDGLTMEPNPVWWKQQPYIQKLNVVGLPDHDAEMSSFDQNLIDIVTTSELTVDTYQKFEEVNYVDYMTQYYDCLIPNMNGMFQDSNLRQALAYALDKRDIISKALLGHAVAVDYPVPPDSFLSGGSANIYEFNRQKAMELLELSGWKDRDQNGYVEQVNGDQITELKFNLLVSINKEDPYRRDVAENIAAQLQNCGMNVSITEVERDIHKQNLEGGAFDLALCTFYLDVNPDVSGLVGTGGARNYGGFTDSEMDMLLQNCKAAVDDVAMKEAYLAMESRFLKTMPHIGLYFRSNALLYKANINISAGLRDRCLFLSIPSWYLFVEEAGS